MAFDFEAQLVRAGRAPLRRGVVTTLQVNVGLRCDLACHHCHVEAGPARREALSAEGADHVLRLLAASPRVETLDLTGGAPELNPGFRRLVQGARALGRRVIDRCNLTVLFTPGQEDTPEFLAGQGVDVVASLPCHTPETVDAQRGRRVFERSIEALRRLNALGYGAPGGPRLDLVYNPAGPWLPPAQEALEARYREALEREHGVRFSRLLTLTNMPIRRFARRLQREGAYEAYLALLVAHFNPAAVPGLMCRSTLSVGWDGRLFDCDFNQALELLTPRPRRLAEIGSLEELAGEGVRTGPHCFGCTAGAGSGCGGALVA